MLVAIYVRVSSYIQATKGISLEAQKNVLIEYCVENGYEYVIFEDKGLSGKSINNRQALQNLLNNLKDFDIVLVWKLSRISRSVRDFSNMLYEFEKNNVRFISYNEKIDTSDASGKLLMYVISIVSEIERDNISENIKLAKAQSFTNGLHTSTNILRL